MKKTIRNCIAALSAFSLLITMSACGSKTDSNTSSGSKNSNTVFADDPYSDIPSSLKGSTVKMVVWYEMPEEEKAVLDAFTAKTGIKVEVTETAGTTAYTEKIVSLMSSNMAPDIIAFNSDTNFPGWTSSVLQPLDKNIFRLDDKIWDKSVMDALKVGDNYYGVNIAGSFTNDSMYVLYYNDTLLKNYGITTPRSYYEQGNWNWDTLNEVLAKIKSGINGVVPISFFKTFPVMWSAGTDFVSYDGNKMSSNLTDTKIVDAYSMMSDWLHKGYYIDNGYAANELSNGKSAMLCGITYGMKSNNGWWSENKGLQTGKLDAVPFPSPKGSETTVPTDCKLWGTAKGSANPEGAAYCLRYFLDPANYDMDSLFLNANLKKTFEDIQKMPKQINYSQGVISYVDAQSYNVLNFQLITADSSQVNVALDSYSNIVTKSVSRVNSNVFGEE